MSQRIPRDRLGLHVSLWVFLLATTPALAGELPAQGCRVYDNDAHHLWNRLYEALFVRVGPDGRNYGCDRLDPLLWVDTKRLVTPPSSDEASRLLDEFLARHGERMIRDPIRRAFLQHDLWGLFDWVAIPRARETHGREWQGLERRLSDAIRRLALQPSEIDALVKDYVPVLEDTSLPDGLLKSSQGWTKLALLEGRAVAPLHLEGYGGRSVFRIFVHLPGEQSATLDYLEELRAFPHPWAYSDEPITYSSSPMARLITPLLVINPELPQFPAGTQWALIRRLCIIDTAGHIRETPIVESVQIRTYRDVPTNSRFASSTQQENAQQFRELDARRTDDGALREVNEPARDFPQFLRGGSDPFELASEQAAANPNRFETTWTRGVLQECRACHPGVGIRSVQSYARSYGPQSSILRPPVLIEDDLDRQPEATIEWKEQRYDFGLLQGLWRAR